LAGGGAATDDAGGGGSAGGAGPPGAVASHVAFTGEQVADLEFRVHLYRAKALLMQAQLKAAKKEIKSALEILQKSKFDLSAAKGKPTTTSSGGVDLDWASSAPALRSMTALYLKANFEYLRTNYRKALKLLSSCHTTGAMLQQLEGPEPSNGSGGGPLASGGGAGAAGLGSAGAACVATAGSAGATYFNNVACVHHKMRKYHAALHYFQRAIATDAEAGGGPGGGPGGQPGLTRDGRVRAGVGCEVRYNAGLALLLVGQPQAALVRFHEAAALLFDRPQLWLRIAECCVQHHCQPPPPSQATAAAGGVGGAVVLGAHAQRRFVLPTEAAADHGRSPAAASAGGWLLPGSGGQCSLPYAVACLHNALFLLTAAAREAARREEEAAEGKLGALFGKKAGGGALDNGGADGAGSARSSGGGGDEKEGDGDGASSAALGLEAAAYLNLAFVHLCLGDPAAALAAAANLLEPRNHTAAAHAAALAAETGSEASAGGSGGAAAGSGGGGGCPPALRTLAHMYAAEALEHLVPTGGSDAAPLAEQLDGAAAKLSAALAAPGGGVACTGSAAGGATGLVVSGAAEGSGVRAALFANVACAALVQPGSDKSGAVKALAEKCARAAVSACPASNHAQRTLVYVLLRTGQTAEALAWLKLYRSGGP
jgi:CCR4-NOT transcription complex subunit 10